MTVPDQQRVFEFEVLPGGVLPGWISTQIRTLLRTMEGKRLRLVFTEHRRIRSLNQNAYYWSVVIPPILEAFHEAGNSWMTAENVHEHLREFVATGIFMRYVVGLDGVRRPAMRSSTTLDTREWEDYMEQVRAWASEWKIYIPLPNEH
jgi:hypothetical protein